MKRLLVAFIIFLAAGPTVSMARADEPREAQAQEIFNSVMSPFCPGRLLQDCPSSQAADLKERIRTELSSGMTKDQILQELYGTFGNSLRAAPEDRGFGVFAWWTPVAALLLGGGAVFIWLRRNRSSGSAVEPEPEKSVPKDLQERIEHELNNS